MKVLAVSSGRRSPSAPEIPTVAEETGIKEFDLTLWVGFFAPRGTPKDIVDRLNREINAIIEQPDVRQKLLDAGAAVTPMSTADFAGFVRAQSEKYRQIVAETGAKAE